MMEYYVAIKHDVFKGCFKYHTEMAGVLSEKAKCQIVLTVQCRVG